MPPTINAGSSTPGSKQSLLFTSYNNWITYGTLAKELIFLSRFFVQTHKGHKQYLNFSIRVLIASDNALTSIAENRFAGGGKSEVDKKVRKAIDLLSDFAKDSSSEDPKSDPNIGGTVIRDAKMSDKSKSPSAILSALKNDILSNPMGHEMPNLKSQRVVEFHLLSSLCDAHPIVVYQALSDNSSLEEVLWNFYRLGGRMKRMTLRDNPHFYAELPLSPDAYGEYLKIDPTENFRHGNKFYVLADKPEVVYYIMTDQVLRSFGNFWSLENAIVFKDTYGRLRGESIIRESLKGTYCGFCKRLLVPTFPGAPRNGYGLRPHMTPGYPRMGWECMIGRLSIDGPFNSGSYVSTGHVQPDSLLPVPSSSTTEKSGYCITAYVTYKTHIHWIDDDSLLQIFSHYRLEHEEDWNIRLVWQNLAHVCQRWRHLVYDSSSYLEMRLILTNDSPPLDTMCHLPPLPLVIDYSNGTGTLVRKDQDNIHLGLQQNGRVRRVALQAPSSSLRPWLELMNKVFPRLRDLSLSSTAIREEKINSMLPESLQAPDLSHLALHGVGFTGFSLLSSAIALSTLTLTHIGESCYFPPGHLVTQLQALPHLEELTIGFAIPIPVPSSERELLPSPIPPVTLPTLKRLTFLGMDVYLDNLVAQINTPLLERLGLTLAFGLAFTLVNLTNLLLRTEGFRCFVARIIFEKDGASIDAGLNEQQGLGRLSLRVNCKPLDWKIDSAAQVCIALGKVMSAVEELTIDLHTNLMPSDWEDTRDDTLWHDLLLPFIGVKKLHIDSSLTLEIALALGSVVGGLVLELLPELQEVDVELKSLLNIGPANKAFNVFVETRESVGRPVHVPGLARPAQHTEPEVLNTVPEVKQQQHAEPGVSNAVPEVNHLGPNATSKYTDNSRKSYKDRVKYLISICQTFIQTQEQTSGSYDELRGVCRVVDQALKLATAGGKKTSQMANKTIKRAINGLNDYEEKYHSTTAVATRLARRMAAVEAEDKDSTNNRKPTPTRSMIVKFHIHRSILDQSPTIVKQMLSQHSRLPEVLWNFSLIGDKNRSLTVERNPQFYKGLPASPDAYWVGFRMDPIKTFLHETISVLVDDSDHAGRVFLEIAGQRRAFGNVWALKDVIIFKDVCGKLEGEGIIGDAIQDKPNLWCIEEPPQSLTSKPALSGNRNSSSRTVAATQITSAEGMQISDWREPVRRMLQSRDVNIRITDKQASSSNSGYAAASS